MPVVWNVPAIAVRSAGTPPGCSPRGLAQILRAIRRTVILGLLGVCISSGLTMAATGSGQRLAVLNQQYHLAQEAFGSAIEAVAASCEQSQLETLAVEFRQMALPLEQQPGNVDNLPQQVQLDIPQSLPAAERAARVRVRQLRLDHAASLYKLSRTALAEKHPSLAYRLVREVLFHDPDHARARGLFGYQRDGDEWTTPFAADMKRRHLVWHDEFGWLLDEHVSRYTAGERFYQKKWISAEREETLRSNFKNGWVIETEHFRVQTNHSLQKGAQLAASVEVFHRYFMREFAAFFKSPQQMDKLFKEGNAGKQGNPYVIHHFRLQTEFVDRLSKECPSARQINGIYMPSHRRAYFFHNPLTPAEASLETMYHEVTHQLLGESTLQTVPVGHVRDFWVTEGMACYFESFRVTEDGTIHVGDINHPRFLAARDQIFVTQNYIPLDRFTAEGMLPFQKGDLPLLQLKYAQATGLTHFFLHYQDGLYRDGFIEYLTQIYSPDQRVRARAKALEQILGVPNTTLDTQYAAYIRAMGPPPEIIP